MDPRSALQAAGLRVTPGRLAVLELLSQAPQPLTHGEVMEHLGSDRFDRATVYRNLTALSDVGLLHRMDIGDHRWRYELTASDSGTPTGTDGVSHPHFICTDCGTVRCLDGSVSLDALGVHQSSRRPVEVQLRGLCEDCD
jgi:Fur family ferric uptake transcriptional regulator